MTAIAIMLAIITAITIATLRGRVDEVWKARACPKTRRPNVPTIRRILLPERKANYSTGYKEPAVQ